MLIIHSTKRLQRIFEIISPLSICFGFLAVDGCLAVGEIRKCVVVLLCVCFVLFCFSVRTVERFQASGRCPLNAHY